MGRHDNHKAWVAQAISAKEAIHWRQERVVTYRDMGDDEDADLDDPDEEPINEVYDGERHEAFKGKWHLSVRERPPMTAGFRCRWQIQWEGREEDRPSISSMSGWTYTPEAARKMAVAALDTLQEFTGVLPRDRFEP